MQTLRTAAAGYLLLPETDQCTAAREHMRSRAAVAYIIYMYLACAAK
jgi:hypothetical protein